MAQGDRSGPVRVLGGAGTGKTVLAMHRAKWLAEHRASIDKKVFFTTFTRNLAADIEENLKTLCSPTVMEKIEAEENRRLVYMVFCVISMNTGSFITASKVKRLKPGNVRWHFKALKVGFQREFYEEELERIILAQGVSTRDEYRLAKRTGRGTILTRAKRDAIWPVFEEYRAQLTRRKLKEVDDAYRDAATLMQDKPQAYASVVVDETQDFGPQALRCHARWCR